MPEAAQGAGERASRSGSQSQASQPEPTSAAAARAQVVNAPVDDDDQGFKFLSNHTRPDKRRASRARSLFSAVLASELNDKGAASVDDLYYRMSWFQLPMTRVEIRQLLELTRRLGVVEPSGYKKDVYGNPTVDETNPDVEEWKTTRAGQKLQRPRALALADLAYRAGGERDAASKLFDLVRGGAAFVIPWGLSLVGASLVDGKKAAWALAVAGLVVLGSLIVKGMGGELQLRAAAQSWHRFKVQRPNRHRYQLNWARSLATPSMILILYLTGASALVGLTSPVQAIAIIAGEAVIAAIIYLAWFRRLRRRWSGDLGEWREVWTERRIVPPKGA